MNNITLWDAQLIYRNFSGKPDQFNPQGRRTFSVVLEDDLAQQLMADGWTVKPLRKRDESDPQRWHLPVTVNFAVRPPKVIVVQGDRKTMFGEEEIGTLDWATIEKADLVIRPRQYDIAGRQGVKAYLQTLGVVIEMDDVLKEYGIPDPVETDEDMPF